MFQQLGAGMDAWYNTSKAWQDFVGHYLTDLLTDKAINIIKTHDTEKPLYLQVAHGAPHTGNTGTELQVRDIPTNDKMFSHIEDTRRRLFAGMQTVNNDSTLFFRLNETLWKFVPAISSNPAFPTSKAL